MAVNLAACVTAFLISFMILPLIIKYTLSKNLVDIPGRRKIHKKVTPSLGGIAIFIGFLVATLIWMNYAQWDYIRYILASLLIVFLIGVRDDLVPFRALHKLYGQIIAIVILLFSGISISSFYGLFGIYEIPNGVGYPLTVLSIVVITNAFNLIDGLDGLAGSVGLVALTAFGSWFFWIGDLTFALFAFAMIGGILAFLVFNWQPAEIFMGDTGAMVIGMLLSVMAIHFMAANESLSSIHPAVFEAPIATAASFIIVPLSDTLRIIILRISKGQSPFQPDKSHIHHALMRIGMTHGKTALTLASVNLFFILVAFALRSYGDTVVLPIVVVTAAMLSILLDRLIIRKLSTTKATQ
jgi:UDP-N-acetylmuramyl pentapeptide phosphotransferase/UDP-N-acetylglucosamine-1-phosphate transferase